MARQVRWSLCSVGRAAQMHACTTFPRISISLWHMNTKKKKKLATSSNHQQNHGRPTSLAALRTRTCCRHIGSGSSAANQPVAIARKSFLHVQTT
jgi:hypothetical protein